MKFYLISDVCTKTSRLGIKVVAFSRDDYENLKKSLEKDHFNFKTTVNPDIVNESPDLKVLPTPVESLSLPRAEFNIILNNRSRLKELKILLKEVFPTRYYAQL